MFAFFGFVDTFARYVDAGDMSRKYVDESEEYRHVLLDVSMGRG